MDVLESLEEWYSRLCKGDWEEYPGVKISTLGNPGWLVDIDLGGTTLESKPFDPLTIENSEHDWIHCKVQDAIFKGHGGPKNLRTILEVFFKWADVTPQKP